MKYWRRCGDAAHPGAQALTGMPHAPGVTDRVGDLAVEIAALEERNEALNRELIQAQAKIDDYICSIPDEYLQLIFRLRFIHCLSWGEGGSCIRQTHLRGQRQKLMLSLS